MNTETLIAFSASAKKASYELLSEDRKNDFLRTLSAYICAEKQTILRANEKDLSYAKRIGLSIPMLDRLKLTEERIDTIVAGLNDIIKLPDPVGRIIESTVRPNGLRIDKISAPIGVIGVIYESRPNVTIDCAALCFKSGNACILRGGKEALNTNNALATLIQNALAKEKINPFMIQVLPTSDKALLKAMLHMDAYIDCIIPRGGEALIRFVTQESTIPVIKHYKGVCSVYIHALADPFMAESIIVNAKCQRPGVCNAAENLFVDREFNKDAFLSLSKTLIKAGVELRVDADTYALFQENGIVCKRATEEDFYEEFLGLILAIKQVSGVDEAIDAIHKYGSKHSEAIITEDKNVAEHFLNKVDASSVYWNASTRFTDGQMFGLGAEIGISTDKLHARGPMGLKELCTYKYQIRGQGQVR
jgi:glutamate-5-semialdehyde dehydrogenase